MNPRFNRRNFNSGNNGPSVQPDESQLSQFRQEIVRNNIPFDDVIRALDAKNLPPQIRQTPYPAIVLTTTNQQAPNNLLIPANPNRMSFLIGVLDLTGALGATVVPMFSYNAPINVGGIFIGVPIGLNSTFSEGNGTVSIDDIYINCVGLTGEQSIIVIPFEGVLAVESHLHLQSTGV